jgi:SAM-dependent methyltransferase
MAGNADQVAYWNEQAGPTWAELQPLLDAQIAPLGLRGLQALAPAAGERILDIGCGCGDTTLAIAQRVAPGGEVMGLDLSAPMLDVARRRAAAIAGISFLQADAQTVQFPVPFEASFSRFGVMFFEDAVAAFTNIHAALVPGGRLVFVCWRHALENAWMMVPLKRQAHSRSPPPTVFAPFCSNPVFGMCRRKLSIRRSADLPWTRPSRWHSASGRWENCCASGRTRRKTRRARCAARWHSTKRQAVSI